MNVCDPIPCMLLADLPPQRKSKSNGKDTASLKGSIGRRPSSRARSLGQLNTETLQLHNSPGRTISTAPQRATVVKNRTSSDAVRRASTTVLGNPPEAKLTSHRTYSAGGTSALARAASAPAVAADIAEATHAPHGTPRPFLSDKYSCDSTRGRATTTAATEAAKTTLAKRGKSSRLRTPLVKLLAAAERLSTRPQTVIIEPADTSRSFAVGATSDPAPVSLGPRGWRSREGSPPLSPAVTPPSPPFLHPGAVERLGSVSSIDAAATTAKDGPDSAAWSSTSGLSLTTPQLTGTRRGLTELGSLGSHPAEVYSPLLSRNGTPPATVVVPGSRAIAGAAGLPAGPPVRPAVAWVHAPAACQYHTELEQRRAAGQLLCSPYEDHLRRCLEAVMTGGAIAADEDAGQPPAVCTGGAAARLRALYAEWRAHCVDGEDIALAFNANNEDPYLGVVQHRAGLEWRVERLIEITTYAQRAYEGERRYFAALEGGKELPQPHPRGTPPHLQSPGLPAATPAEAMRARRMVAYWQQRVNLCQLFEDLFADSVRMFAQLPLFLPAGFGGASEDVPGETPQGRHGGPHPHQTSPAGLSPMRGTLYHEFIRLRARDSFLCETPKKAWVAEKAHVQELGAALRACWSQHTSLRESMRRPEAARGDKGSSGGGHPLSCGARYGHGHGGSDGPVPREALDILELAGVTDVKEFVQSTLHSRENAAAAAAALDTIVAMDRRCRGLVDDGARKVDSRGSDDDVWTEHEDAEDELLLLTAQNLSPYEPSLDHDHLPDGVRPVVSPAGWPHSPYTSDSGPRQGERAHPRSPSPGGDGVNGGSGALASGRLSSLSSAPGGCGARRLTLVVASPLLVHIDDGGGESGEDTAASLVAQSTGYASPLLRASRERHVTFVLEPEYFEDGLAGELSGAGPTRDPSADRSRGAGAGPPGRRGGFYTGSPTYSRGSGPAAQGGVADGTGMPQSQFHWKRYADEKGEVCPVLARRGMPQGDPLPSAGDGGASKCGGGLSRPHRQRVLRLFLKLDEEDGMERLRASWAALAHAEAHLRGRVAEMEAVLKSRREDHRRRGSGGAGVGGAVGLREGSTTPRRGAVQRVKSHVRGALCGGGNTCPVM